MGPGVLPGPIDVLASYLTMRTMALVDVNRGCNASVFAFK